jgi:hypothetical protein
MNRRRFLHASGLGGAAAALTELRALPAERAEQRKPGGPAAQDEERVRTTANLPPRKVIVGTVVQSFWGRYPGLRNRLEQLTGIVDQMAAQAKQAHGRSLDLAILPETAITGEAGDDAVAHSVPFEGEVAEAFTRKARQHRCYIVVPSYLLDSRDKRRCSNAAILVGFHYYEDEDCGIFWSNDPKTTIGQMARSIGVLELEEEMARVRQFYRAAGVRI